MFFLVQKIVTILLFGPGGAKAQNSGLMKGGGRGSLRDVFMGKIDWEFISVEYFECLNNAGGVSDANKNLQTNLL